MSLATPEPIDVSIVVACLNEVENVERLGVALKAELARVGVSHEIIFIDNGSTDGTIPVLRDMCARDKSIRVILNNTNFGQMRSPAHGIYQTTGATVVCISADFQDPPTMIGDFIERWRRGAKIVLGVRESEEMTIWMRFVRSVGYGFFRHFGDYRLISGATGFGLYDRAVVDCLKQWRDPEPFFRGMLVESGFPLATVPYNRPKRTGGISKNKFLNLLHFSWIAIGSAGKYLLRMPLYIGIVLGLVVIVTFILGLIAVVLSRSASGLFIAAAIELAFAIIFVFLGLLGEQVRMISEMTRNIPLVTEKERLNFN